MKKRRKSREIKEAEEDLLFYLEYYKNFNSSFKRIADKEIKELEAKIKSNPE